MTAATNTSMKKTDTLYRKAGRRYIPVAATWHEDPGADHLSPGQFRLTYACTGGGWRYEYNVTPATAPVIAATLIAREAMEAAITAAARMHPLPTYGKPYTPKQKALIAKFISDMGGMYPTHWQATSARDIAQAGIKAMLEFKP